jgi:hypothetical protein
MSWLSVLLALPLGWGRFCWIRLIIKTEMLTEHRVGELLDECNQLCNIIAQSIVTAKTRREKKK